MRLLIVSQYFWPEVFRVNEVAAYLAGRGHDVVVLTGLPNYPGGQIFSEYKDKPHSYSHYKGADIVRVPLVSRGKDSKTRLLANYMSFMISGLVIGSWKLRGRSFDAILVVQLSPITSAIPAIFQRWLKNRPIAMWILDLWPETLSAVGVLRSPRSLRWVGKLVSFIYNRCDCVLVQSKAFVPSVQKHLARDVRVEYWPAWAEEAFERDLATVQVAPEVVPFLGTFNVLFAGNIGEAQDLPTVLEAAERLKDRREIRWLIVGDGRAAAQIREQIRQRGLEEQVRMLGRFPMERMPSFFKAASVLLVSLKSEPVFSLTIPGKLQSYMRAGLPIVAMLDGEGARVVQESGGGLTCAAGDSIGLANAVTELASWPEERLRSVGQQARSYCETEFDREKLLSQVEERLEALARLNPREA